MLLSTAQACGAIGKGRATLARLIQKGEIEAIKGPARNSHLRIPLASIQAYLERNRMAVGGDQ
ncbi:helix-turn-helix domain-containing protein [Sphaerisporangium sp. TRM90804]|uniref:helix-turn-helix domain-containing protein n=1 Tax=Sphaerisporangium sp. TRM90804 TaxID=3031113 RepID=UPI00244C7DAD|nr:helix-turn-helix domain-containing protein [Sphaerisporangium sp. TRM90804]MDH2424837.1 helix-turn-helix domain-containing protein [Sphaerisporangium sp. TRM90804]